MHFLQGNPPEFESRDGVCRYSSGWRCEHRYPEIKNMARGALHK